MEKNNQSYLLSNLQMVDQNAFLNGSDIHKETDVPLVLVCRKYQMLSVH